MRKRLILLLLMSIMIISGPLVSHAQTMEPDFHEMFDGHGSIMLLIDSETGSIKYANKAAADFYGYSIEELTARKISEINALGPEETAAEMALAVEEKRNYFVFEHRVASGDIKTVEVYSYPYLYDDNQMLFSIINDITDKAILEKKNKMITNAFFLALSILILILLLFSFQRKRNIENLKQRNKELNNAYALQKTYINADDSLIYLKDENLKYVFVNKATENFYNKDSSEMIGHDDFELTNFEFASKRRETDIEAIEKDTLVVGEVRWENRIYKTTKFPVKLLNGSVGVGAYIKDVTEENKIKKDQEKTLHRNWVLAEVFRKDFSSAEEQLDYVLHESLKLTESKFGYIYLYDEEKEELILNSWSKEVMDECRIVNKKTTYQLDKTGLWGEAVRQRRPIVVNNFEMPNDMKKGYPQGHVPLTKFMTIPIIIGNKIVAVIGLANKEEDYSDLDVYQIGILMNGVWNAKGKREALDQLEVEKEKYLLTLLSIGDGVLVVNQDGDIEMLNTVAEELTGWTAKEAVGKHYKEVFVLSHERDGAMINDPIGEVFETNTIREMDNHAMLTAKDGRKYHVEDSASPINDHHKNILGVVLVFRDVSDKKEQRKKIEYLSFHDSLTNLYNRRFFEEELKRLDTERNFPLSLILVDVNGLKLINDAFGHKAGDILLQKVAGILKQECRADDIIARVGGDEFVILLPKTDSSQIENILRRIQKATNNEKVEAINISVSYGWETKKDKKEDIQDIYNKAEMYMYQHKISERASMRYEAIKMIMKTLYEKIPREEEHSNRVSKLSSSIGLALGLSDADIHKLQMSGLLHDIGKIAVSNDILNKNAPLSDLEWIEIKRHSESGYSILSSSNDYAFLAEDILAHHERFDGTGYPKGIKEEEIPLHARIIAVADAYDAMISERPYRKPLSEDSAIEEIKRNAGTQFDPHIVEIFIEKVL
ncbi:MAG: hypothetical protein APF84_08170 [Gracilibacter sp. BRH_c7a]|nr:MAG: hypothetical protein APF84_08170 [Gracilibacter sp. BRH_c7a]